MSAADVENAIREVMETHTGHADWLSGDKTRIQCAMVDPILWALGWRTWLPSECKPNPGANRGRQPDYVLFGADGNAAVAITVGASRPRRRYDRQTKTATTCWTHGSPPKPPNRQFRLIQYPPDNWKPRLSLAPEHSQGGWQCIETSHA